LTPVFSFGISGSSKEVAFRSSGGQKAR
jgi:hypothetical protein